MVKLMLSPLYTLYVVTSSSLPTKAAVNLESVSGSVTTKFSSSTVSMTTSTSSSIGLPSSVDTVTEYLPAVSLQSTSKSALPAFAVISFSPNVKCSDMFTKKLNDDNAS